VVVLWVREMKKIKLYGKEYRILTKGEFTRSVILECVNTGSIFWAYKTDDHECGYTVPKWFGQERRYEA
jgi:hypothetical protein